MKIKRIICALDFSEHSEETIAYAASMASTHGAELHLLHVVDHLHGFDNFEILVVTPHEIAKQLEADAVNQLTALRAAFTKESANIVIVVRHGKPSTQIVEMARDVEADLIVMGSHGKTGLSPMFVGSVAEAVVRGAQCAVLVVK